MSSKHDLLELLNDCPMGYAFGKVVMSRSRDENDIVVWLARLYVAKESLRADLDSETVTLALTPPVIRGLRKLLSLTDMFLDTIPDLTDSQVGDIRHAQEWIKWKVRQ